MAQTTHQVARSCAAIWISDDCATWYNAGGEVISLQDPQQSVMSGETYTLTGDTALISGGKREPIEITVNIVYTETDQETYERVRNIFETAGCGKRLCVKYSPRGGNAGDELLVLDGILTEFGYPPVDAESAGPIMTYFKVKGPYWTTSIIAS